MRAHHPRHCFYQSALLCFQSQDFTYTKPNSLFAPEVFGALSLLGTTLLYSLTLGGSARLPDSDSGQAPRADLSSNQCLQMSALVPQTRTSRQALRGLRPCYHFQWHCTAVRHQGAGVQKERNMVPDSVSALSCVLVSDPAQVAG